MPPAREASSSVIAVPSRRDATDAEPVVTFPEDRFTMWNPRTLVRLRGGIGIALALAGTAATPAAASASASPAAGPPPSAGASVPPLSGDPLDSLRAAPALDLGLLERAVLARNSSLGAVRAARDAASAQADAAGALDDPMLDAMAAPRSLGAAGVDPNWEASLSQHLPLFGQRGLRRDAARAEARAAGEDVRAMRLDLLRDARTLYFRLYETVRAQAVNAELRALVEQFRRVALQKYAAGTVGETDALQAEVELAMLDHERVVLSRDRRTLDARVRALLHDEGDRPLPDPPDSLDLDRAPAGAANGAAAADLDALPMVRAAGAMRDARAAEERLARRANAPELTLSAGYDRSMPMEEMRAMVGIGLNVPIWRGRVNAQVRAARAALERADRERDARRDEARARLAEALARVEDTEHERHVIDGAVIPATVRSLASARSAYEANRGDFLTLLSAERDLAAARLSKYRADAEYGVALADLDRALGNDLAPADGRSKEDSR